MYSEFLMFSNIENLQPLVFSCVFFQFSFKNILGGCNEYFFTGDFLLFFFPYVRLKSKQLDEWVSPYMQAFESFLPFIVLFSSFALTVDGRSDYGPGRSKGGGIFGNGQ